MDIYLRFPNSVNNHHIYYNGKTELQSLFLQLIADTPPNKDFNDYNLLSINNISYRTLRNNRPTFQEFYIALNDIYDSPIYNTIMTDAHERMFFVKLNKKPLSTQKQNNLFGKDNIELEFDTNNDIHVFVLKEAIIREEVVITDDITDSNIVTDETNNLLFNDVITANIILNHKILLLHKQIHSILLYPFCKPYPLTTIMDYLLLKPLYTYGYNMNVRIKHYDLTYTYITQLTQTNLTLQSSNAELSDGSKSMYAILADNTLHTTDLYNEIHLLKNRNVIEDRLSDQLRQLLETKYGTALESNEGRLQTSYDIIMQFTNPHSYWSQMTHNNRAQQLKVIQLLSETIRDLPLPEGSDI